MGNMCCRREVYSPHGAETDLSRCGNHQQIHQQHPSKQQQHHPAMSSAYHSAGDDCAINELLEGRMDLDVLMPDGRQVRLTVERRTPMMDLLVQAASATKISPGGHVIHVLGDSNKGNTTLQYKPSTPIGSLDTNTISIVPKKEAGEFLGRRTSKTAHRPFEPTFRVQVHLPRNQLTVLRVSPRVKISELKSMVCKEKGLDTSRYQLVRPSGPTEPLSGDTTLGEYGSTEITLLSNSSIESHICNSTSHIISYPKRAEEQKRKNGILRLLAEDANNKATNNNSSCFIDSNQQNHHFSKSDDARIHQNKYKSKKRRPAPPPPPPILPEAPSHSRQSSSDSSGYHEATSSFLHEEHSSEEKASSDSSGVSSLDAKGPSIQPSPPVHNMKKKKAPAPPPPSLQKEKINQKEPAPAIPFVSENSSFPNPVQKDPVVQNSPDAQKDSDVQLKPDLPTNCKGQENIFIENNYDQKDLIVDSSEPILKNEKPEESCTIPADPLLEKDSASKEPVVSKYPAPQKDPTFQESQKIEKNDLIYANNIQGNNFIQKDQVLPDDEIVSKKATVSQEEIPKHDAEEKLDFCDLRENGGQQFPALATSKPLLTTNVSADEINEKKDECKESLREQLKDSGVRTVTSDASFFKTTTDNGPRKDKAPSKGEAVSTRVALVALNARIEQDVTQQEIASSIQAAFHSLDCTPQPSLLSIKQRNNGDSVTYTKQNSSSSLCSSIESFNSHSSKASIIRTPLKEDFHVECVKESVSDDSKNFSGSEKEALLIDEEPSPRLASAEFATTKNLKRSSSLLNFIETTPKNISSKNSKRVRHLQRSLSDLTSDSKEDFEAEQERLQREYIKLQRQFILWQQQLMNNHAMLREECIVPQYARTLRQSHSLPEGEDYSEEATPSVPLVSRSLSYEPTKDRCSTLPRSAINIPSFEFSSIQVNNGTSTLRSSKTKNYFKPPQVRASTKSRQRLPPEIKKEGDVDISDDTKMLTTILPSFESLKLITENNNEDIQSCVSRLKDTITSTKVVRTASQEVKNAPLVHQSSTFSKLNSHSNNSDRIADRNLKCENGDTGQSKSLANCSKITEQPPPPPPLPVGVVSKGPPVTNNCLKSPGQRNGTLKKAVVPNMDSREQLMLEIRKCGGRTALKKISLAS